MTILIFIVLIFIAINNILFWEESIKVMNYQSKILYKIYDVLRKDKYGKTN